MSEQLGVSEEDIGERMTQLSKLNKKYGDVRTSLRDSIVGFTGFLALFGKQVIKDGETSFYKTEIGLAIRCILNLVPKEDWKDMMDNIIKSEGDVESVR